MTVEDAKELFEVDVLRSRYTVIEQLKLVDDTDQWGETLQRARTIRLDPDADEPTVLVHELIHTAEAATNMEPLEEATVHQLAKVLVCILGDNPEVTTWILQQLWKDEPEILKTVATALKGG